KALASTLDSYSWVVMVSDTTLMFMPRKGLAASMNHSSSFSCSSRERVEGWNSSSHFSAIFSSSGVAALAVGASKMTARTRASGLARAAAILFLSMTHSLTMLEHPRSPAATLRPRLLLRRNLPAGVRPAPEDVAAAPQPQRSSTSNQTTDKANAHQRLTASVSASQARW